MFQHAFETFLTNIKNATLLEYLAVVSGIASVWFSRRENILVYPVGLASTVPYVYISFQNHLFGEGEVNLYYTVMSIYGWMLWAKRDKQDHHLVVITNSSRKEWIQQLLFFTGCYIVIYFQLAFLKKWFSGAIPWGDAFATATAFTGMWLMARKKVESWYWWILTNIASIPLYFVKTLVLTSVYYLILLVFAFWGLAEWRKRATENESSNIEVN